jgi:hypothetical protein
MLDPGATYTVAQVGDDTVIDLGDGDRMVLMGVKMDACRADGSSGPERSGLNSPCGGRIDRRTRNP